MADLTGWAIQIDRTLSRPEMWQILGIIGDHFDVCLVSREDGCRRVQSCLSRYAKLGLVEKIERFKSQGVICAHCFNGTSASPVDLVALAILPDGEIDLYYDKKSCRHTQKKAHQRFCISLEWTCETLEYLSQTERILRSCGCEYTSQFARTKCCTRVAEIAFLKWKLMRGNRVNTIVIRQNLQHE